MTPQELTDLFSNEESRKELFDMMGSSSESENTQQSEENDDPLSKILPGLLSALSGKGGSIDEKRLNLVRALEPYLSEKRGIDFERAIRMANLAKTAKDTLKILGR